MEGSINYLLATPLEDDSGVPLYLYNLHCTILISLWEFNTPRANEFLLLSRVQSNWLIYSTRYGLHDNVHHQCHPPLIRVYYVGQIPVQAHLQFIAFSGNPQSSLLGGHRHRHHQQQMHRNHTRDQHLIELEITPLIGVGEVVAGEETMEHYLIFPSQEEDWFRYQIVSFPGN